MMLTAGKLKKGDIVVISNALTGLSEYPVKEVIGNKAITDFRDFNIKIYPSGHVYEYGKKTTPWGNHYWIKEKRSKNDRPNETQQRN